MRESLRGSSLEELEREDRIIAGLIAQIRSHDHRGVEDRFAYGNCAKELIRRIGDREAALRDVAAVARRVPELRSVASRLMSHDMAIRSPYDEVGDLSRGVRSLDLNTGQDFDSALRPLLEIVEREVSWELEVGIELIEGWLSRSESAGLHRQGWVQHHAPTHLGQGGARWWERNALCCRLVTIWDHLRDYPRSSRDPGSSWGE